MCDEKDMIDVNLNQSSQTQANTSSTADGFPYGSDDGKVLTSEEVYFCQKSQCLAKSSKRGKRSPPPPTSISCLRQMYCPKCQQRLHEDGIRMERFVSFCCFPLFPLYPCCAKRANSCEVICAKCDYHLGSWKRQ